MSTTEPGLLVDHFLGNVMLLVRACVKKIISFLLNHLKEKKDQLLEFHYARFIWAFRSMFASIFSLVIVYFYPGGSIWLISSSAMGLQLLAAGQRAFKREYIFLGSLVLSLFCASAAFFTRNAALLYGIVVASVFFSFYITHRGNTFTVLGLWSSALLLINVFFPIKTFLEWKIRFFLLLIGMSLAYLLSYFKWWRNRDENLPQIILSLNAVSKKEYLKYALKGGLVAWLSLLIAHLLHIQNTYWVLFGAITVMKLETEASLRRSKERIYGTLLGLAISLVFALFLLHWPMGIVLVVPFCIFGAVYYFFYYSIGMLFITLLFVLTFGVITHHPFLYGLERLIDTIIGVFLALTVSYLWPYREKNVSISSVTS